jgi:hypothetical protein
VQQTLGQTLETGPVLLVLFASPAPLARLRQLAGELPQPGDAGLQLIAVGLRAEAPPNGAQAGPFVVGVSSEVIDVLALFRTPDDGGETEFLVDRAGNVRARWTANLPGGLARPTILLAYGERVARITTAAPSHSSHAH